MNEPSRIRILYVDDYPLDRELVRDALTRDSDRFDLIEACSREEFETALAENHFDLVLSDFNILGFEGLHVLQAVQAKDAQTPVIIVTGTGSEEIAVEAMKRGAADYVIKKPNHIHRLPLTIQAVLEKNRMAVEKRKVDQRYRLIFENSGEAILLTDSDGVIYSANPEACRIFQRDEEDIIRIGWRGLVDETDPQLLKAIEERQQTGRFRGEPYLVRKDGAIFPGEISTFTFRDADGQEQTCMIICDMTDRKRAEVALRESQEQLEGIFNTTMEAIISVDEDHRIVIFNPSAEQIFGCVAAEALGQPLDRFIPPSSRQAHRGLIREFGRANISHRTMEAPAMDLTCRRADGELFPSEISISKLDRDGKKLYTAVLRDITERKQAEKKIKRQLEYLNALRVIDQAIASTFDLRITLNTLLAQTVALLEIDAAAVLLLNPLHTLEFAAGLGFQTDAIRVAKIKIGNGLAGKAALERKLIQIPNLAMEPENPLLSIGFKDENFVSYHGVPLIAKGEVIGVLELFHRSMVFRDQEWLDFLLMLSSQAAIAIDNAQLFDNLQKSNSELSQAYDATIEGWSRALDIRDKETEGHTLRVVVRTLELCKRMGLDDAQLTQVHRGALLHDIGKLGVPDGILLKPGPLSEEEWVLMRKHPIFAYEMLSPIQYLTEAIDIPYCHHEWWDGSGYPRGLQEEQIPLTARIFAVVDVYDALTSDRPYRNAWTKKEALEYIRGLSGSQFDPNVVEVFLTGYKENL